PHGNGADHGGYSGLDEPDTQPAARLPDGHRLRDRRGRERAQSDRESAPARDRCERAGTLHRVADIAEIVDGVVAEGVGHLSIIIPPSMWSRLSVGSGAAIDVEPTLSRLGRRLRAGATFASTNRCLAVDQPPRLHSPGDEGDRIVRSGANFLKNRPLTRPGNKQDRKSVV